MEVSWRSGLPDDSVHAPLAPDTGPFPHLSFLRAWYEELGRDYEPLTADGPEGTVTLMRAPDGVIEFLGEPDLTDYHTPLGDLKTEDFQRIASGLGREALRLDSLPSEAAEPLAAGLRATGRSVRQSIHEYALRLELPQDVDAFYAALTKRDRHELRRKRRRYEEAVGKVAHRTEIGAGQAFAEFVRLHRLAPGSKGEFMTGAREAFFRRLAAQDGWRVDFLETPTGKAAACLFGFAEGKSYYLYNSSFDPGLAATSPGLVVLTEMIEHAISAGFQLFDFLKGDEDYKRRLGATPRPLHLIEVGR